MVQVRATVVVATHDRGPLLAYSVASALRQTIEDLEILIVGDGATLPTREAALVLERRDPRVRFIENPKAPHRGEANRHAAVLQARGEIVCHLDDDDLWLPDHVETLLGLLSDADLAMTLPVVALTNGAIVPFPVDLADPIHRRLVTHPRSTFASSPTFVGYRTRTYRRLPRGWSPPPVGGASDKFAWAQILANPAHRAVSSFRPTAIGLPSSDRAGRSLDERTEEHRQWAGRLADPACCEQFRLDVLMALAHEHVGRLRSLWALYGLALDLPIIGDWLIQAGKLAFGRRSYRPAPRLS